MATVTIEELRQHIETDLVDGALERLLDGAVFDVESRFGSDAAQTIERDGCDKRYISLPRPASGVTSVVEKDEYRNTLATLDTTDYVLRYGGRMLERLNGGTNARGWGWAPLVVITFTPLAEEVIRNLVIVDLVKLDISYEGLNKETHVGDTKVIGDKQNLGAYQSERETIMKRLSNSRGFRFA